MAEKAQDDIDSQTELKNRHVVRREFWSKLLHAMNAKSTLYQNINPGIYHWIGAGSGIRGLGLNFATTKSYGRAELYIDRGNKEENEYIFDELSKNKDQIEEDFGESLVWEKLETKRACRIKTEASGNVFDKDLWEEMIEFMTDGMVRLDKVLKPSLKSIGEKLKHYQPSNEEEV